MFYVLSLGFVVVFTIGLGIYFMKKEDANAKGKLKFILGANVALFILMLVAGTISAFTGASFAASGTTATATTTSSASGLGFIAASLSTGLAAIGTGYAVGSVGSSALGAVSENPKILGKTLIFVGLAEGIAIYGLIISILILGKL
ncbi:MAG: ATPase [Clostridiales bacterium 38-18]|nr:MAG: ATPase [Clostridiales bacterium 38-18]